MSFKNTFFKWLDKLENVKISPMWGYSFAVCLILFWLVLNLAESSIYAGGGTYVDLWFFVSSLTLWSGIVLLVLTKKSKRYGAKIARLSSVISVLVAVLLSRFIPSKAQMNGDCYVNIMFPICLLIYVVAGFLGYACGKYIAKKIKDSNMATVKEELSQS